MPCSGSTSCARSEPTADERASVDLTRFARAKVPALSLVGLLERQGWRRGETEDGGIYRSHSRAFEAAGVIAVVEYEGVAIGDPDVLGDQAVEHCYVLDGARRARWGDVDPIVRCEVLATLEDIAQRA